MTKKVTTDPKTITFKRGRDKDRIDEIFNGRRMRNLMPAKVAGKTAPMTLWAIEYLNKLVMTGAVRTAPEIFAEDPLEVQSLQVENDRLKQRVQELEARLQGTPDGGKKRWWQWWK